MVVTYRLAGVDGEATEEVVASLPDSDAATDQNPELKFGIARYIAEVRACPLERSEMRNVGVGPHTVCSCIHPFVSFLPMILPKIS